MKTNIYEGDGEMPSPPKKMVNLAGANFDRYMHYMYGKEWLRKDYAGMYKNILRNIYNGFHLHNPVDVNRLQVMGNPMLMNDGYNYLPVRYTMDDGKIKEGLVNINGVREEFRFRPYNGFVPDKRGIRGADPEGVRFETTEAMDSYDWNPNAAISYNIVKAENGPNFYDSQMTPGQYFRGADGVYYKNKNPNFEMVTNEDLANKQFYVDKDNGMTVEDKGFARGGSMPTKQKKPTKPSPEWIKNQYGLIAHIAPGYSNDEWDVYI